jgi:hypothetical protein
LATELCAYCLGRHRPGVRILGRSAYRPFELHDVRGAWACMSMCNIKDRGCGYGQGQNKPLAPDTSAAPAEPSHRARRTATLFMPGLFGSLAANEFIARLVSGHCHMSYPRTHWQSSGAVDPPRTADQRRLEGLRGSRTHDFCDSFVSQAEIAAVRIDVFCNLRCRPAGDPLTRRSCLASR